MRLPSVACALVEALRVGDETLTLPFPAYRQG
jgi:hypothetical protein